MKRNTLYALWLTAFGMKATGAAWDASYHFKYLRELTQASHVLNIIGFVLAALLWMYMWRTEPAQHKRPLKVMLAGFLVFLAAIPFDDYWHNRFGIDLTTWSPPHSILYAGTIITILGVLLQAREDAKRDLITGKLRVVMQVMMLAFLLEAFWFPLVQQEQGVIAYYLFLNGTPIASDEILQFLTDPKSQIYGGIPDWLYGVYACLVIGFLFKLVKHFDLPPYSSLLVAGIYVAFRTAMNFVFHLSVYQESTVPYFLLLAAACFDGICYLYRGRYGGWTKLIMVNVLIVLTVYAVSLLDTEYPWHPPMPGDSIWMAGAAAVIGYVLAAVVYQKVLLWISRRPDEAVVPPISQSIF